MSVDARLNVNVALNRPSYQSGLYIDGIGNYHAANANDGNHNPHLNYGSCMVSIAQPIPWWAVDLREPLYVYGVKFTNRVYAGMYAIYDAIILTIE